MEKYGFVYIWRDRKHNRFYIGSHWGHERDKYVCSSSWMMQAYKRRPSDFKRRILARVSTSRKDLYAEENRWLSFIKPDEVKKRYYNLHLKANHWVADELKATTVAGRIADGLKRSDRPFREKIKASLQGMRHYNNGVINRKFRPDDPIPEGFVSGRLKGQKAWNKGLKGVVKQSEEQKQGQRERMLERAKDQDFRERHRQAMRNSPLTGKNNIGKAYYNNGVEDRVLFEHEVPEGFVKGRLFASVQGKSLYTDGVKEVYVAEGDPIPDGFHLGRRPGRKNPKKGMIWYSNGTVSIKLFPSDPVPDGFELGRRGSKSVVGTIWCNNGIENRRFAPSEIPEGFVRGRVKYHDLTQG